MKEANINGDEWYGLSYIKQLVLLAYSVDSITCETNSKPKNHVEDKGIYD